MSKTMPSEEEARRLERARQMGFSCDIEGLPRDARLDAYTELVLSDPLLSPDEQAELVMRFAEQLQQRK